MPVGVWWIWMILAVILVICEIFTVGFFLLWFGIGAFIAGILALIGLGPAWQWGAFVVVSGILFSVTRRFAELFTKAQPPNVGADRIIGREGFVIEKIDCMKNTGLVRLGTEEWKARSADESVIFAGKKVKVVGQEGTHIIVETIKKGVRK
jgi:membrane protein implicated in regulation of membrane protease activity